MTRMDVLVPRHESHDGGSHRLRRYSVEMAKVDPIQKRVFDTYLHMHSFQTVGFVNDKHKHWLRFDHAELPLLEALDQLANCIDESDPDVDVPNIMHAYQTAERIRHEHPDNEWLQLTGLVHDLGKIMTMWGEPQWSVVGDTFPVGCRPAKSIVFVNETFHENADTRDPRYNTDLGMYSAHCGLDNLLMSWGHDEFIYQVLRHHPQCQLPPNALNAIRFHSFYPWHTGGDYQHLCNQLDQQTMADVHLLNKYDLYSKVDELPDLQALRPYYQKLVDKWCPGLVKF